MEGSDHGGRYGSGCSSKPQRVEICISWYSAGKIFIDLCFVLFLHHYIYPIVVFCSTAEIDESQNKVVCVT